MSALTFTLKAPLQQRVDLSALTPDNLAGKSVADIAAILLVSGREKLRVDSVFDIAGSDAADIVFNNASGKLDFIGSHMKTGKITINGGAGSYLGLQMRGGHIVLNGNADAFAASGMANGLIEIKGNVGDFLAAALPGDRKGMKGGMVLISGNVGERAGDQMRRGIILIEGNAGAYLASRMLAGTIGVLGSVGEYVGYGMRRGTLLLMQEPRLHATVQDCGTHTLPFLSLMFKSFRDLPSKFAQINQNRVQRYAGDIANDGKGEILVFK
ncbi:formylmethanofuran dehydrogenase, subunit C [Methylobacillus rhizosphaerae]|uniref:Formylmethanofuran dehydrogenase, subunit C n=1 Tax=Methylobacillus rhizosphaerae TaxID=551994 RepID=A0A238YK70_9PROT|nr:formylmethanofuran dehydrogenase subunit C [Methylobacillus rhizosphaerae]SNR71023.1 formylmethanofuran dehydrogenase, subunit C [Methylobacillus rhizosphaerae]